MSTLNKQELIDALCIAVMENGEVRELSLKNDPRKRTIDISVNSETQTQNYAQLCAKLEVEIAALTNEPDPLIAYMKQVNTIHQGKPFKPNLSWRKFMEAGITAGVAIQCHKLASGEVE